MGEPARATQPEYVTTEYLDRYVESRIIPFLPKSSEPSLSQADKFELLERIVRVEEELKHQRELMRQGFSLVYWLLGLGIPALMIMISVYKFID